MTALEAIAVASNHTNHILQFEIFSWSCHTYHVTETKKVIRVTFHQRPKIVPTHRQKNMVFFHDDTALFAVLLQGRRHAASCPFRRHAVAPSSSKSSNWRRRVVVTRPPHRRRIGATLPPHHRHIAATSPPHCRRVAATLPPGCRHIAARVAATTAATTATGPYFCP